MGSTRTWGRRLRLAGVLAAIAGLLAVVGWAVAIRWHPSLDSYPLQGIDVSEDTGAIDWPTVRAGGADFAYIRATAGVDRRDTQFAANWPAAFAAGLRRGAVHDFSLCRPAVDQANAFIVTVPRADDALPAAVAIDESPECSAPPDRAALIEQVARFAGMVERHTGKPVLLRIAPAIEARYDLARGLNRPLWATGNFVAPTYLSRPWRLWRANAMRRIDGAERAVGWNVVAR